MNSPGVLRAKRRIHIPELSLQHLATGVVETAGVLAMIFRLTTDVGPRTRRRGSRRWFIFSCLREPQRAEGLEDLLGSWDPQELLRRSPHHRLTGRRLEVQPIYLSERDGRRE
jgi:hypothetical protein